MSVRDRRYRSRLTDSRCGLDGVNLPGDGGNQGLLGVTRTICIGIGGTGRDVLMRIRRTIIDQFGSLQEFPIVAFIQIDTDQGATRTTGLSTGDNYQGQPIKFNPNEVIHARVSEAEAEQFKKNHELLQKNPYANNPDKHILEWFPDTLINNLSAMNDGAGQIRPAGRLAFFKNFNAIKAQLTYAYNQVNGADVNELNRKWGNAVNPGLRVYVTGSLCGGTGSGMVLDMGYLVRALYSPLTQTESHGYFVIATDLYGNNDSVKANTYAALMELDYYNRVGTEFEANYPGMPPFKATWEPYKFLYLISNSTPGAEFTITGHDKKDSKGKIYNLLAQKICLFFTSSPSADAARSARDNLNGIDAMEPVDQHPRPNRQRYITAGLSSIYFPQDRILALAANQAKQKLIQFWQQGVGQSPAITTVLDTFLVQYQWQDGQTNDPIKRDLKALPLESKQTFNTLLNSWSQNQQSLINNCQNKQQQDSLKEIFPSVFQAFFRNVEHGNTEQTRGAWLTTLITETTTVTHGLMANIDQYLNTLLDPTNNYFSVVTASHWLDALQTKIYQEQTRYQQDLKQQKVSSSQNINMISNDLVQTIHGIQSNLWPVGKNPKVQNSCRNAVEAVKSVVQDNYNHQLLLQCLVVTQDLLTHVQEKQEQVTALQKVLTQLLGQYEQQEKNLENLNTNERIGLALIQPEDIEQTTTQVIPSQDPSRRQQLNSLTQNVMQLNPGVSDQKMGSLAPLLNPNHRDQEVIKRGLDQQIDQELSGAAARGLGSVIHRFMNYDSPVKLQQYLVNLWRQAQVLLPLQLIDGHYNNFPQKLVAKVAYYDPGNGDPAVAAFVQLMQNAGILDGQTQVVQLTASEQHHVLFMTEYAGFPLRIINDLQAKQMQYAYRNSGINGDYSHKHTDKRKILTDIIPPDAGLMAEIQELFFRSLALGFFTLENGSLYYRQDGHNVLMGDDWSAAIDQLAWAEENAQQYQQATLTTFLRNNLNREIESIKQDPQRWLNPNNGFKVKVQQLIDEIRAYPQTHINYYYGIRVAGAGPILAPGQLAQTGILEHFIQEVDAMIQARISSGDSSEKILTGQTSQNVLDSRGSQKLLESSDNHKSSEVWDE